MLDQPYQINNNQITRDCSAACFKETLPDQQQERPSIEGKIAKNTRKIRPMTQKEFERLRDEQAVDDAEKERKAIRTELWQKKQLRNGRASESSSTRGDRGT